MGRTILIVSESFICEDPTNPTSEGWRNINLATQAQNILYDCFTREEFNRITQLETAKEVWHVFYMVYQGIFLRCEIKMDVLSNRLKNQEKRLTKFSIHLLETC